MRDADTGALVSSGRAPHPPANPPRSEQHPDAWSAALDRALAAAGRPEVAAIAVAAQQHGMVVVDQLGRPLRPAKLWNDTESARDATDLVERLGPPEWAAACGSVPVPSFTITKLAWLRRVEPAVFAQIAAVLLPHDYLTWSLTGERVTDRGDASGTGYWSPAENRWRPDLLSLVDDAVDWVARLPRVLGPQEPAGLWRGALVGPGTGDNMGAALGLGLQMGEVAVSVGTSGTLFGLASTPAADASGAVAGFADATGRYLPLVCTLNATKVTDTFARLLGVDHAGFDELAQAVPAGAGGLTLVPYLDGERTPNRPQATGSLSGLRSDVSREQVARAAVEGVTCGLLDGLDALLAAGLSDPAQLLLVGGGARSMAYRRVLADLSGRPVIVPGPHELVALGACVQAAAVLDARPPQEVADAWRATRCGDTIVEPDASVDRLAIRSAYGAAATAAG